MKKWSEKDLKIALEVKKGEVSHKEAQDKLGVDSCQLNSIISAFNSLEKDSKTKRATKLMKKIWAELKSK